MNLPSLLASAPAMALFPTQAQAKAARKRLYRLGAKRLGFSIHVKGCELWLRRSGPVSITPTESPQP